MRRRRGRKRFLQPYFIYKKNGKKIQLKKSFNKTTKEALTEKRRRGRSGRRSGSLLATKHMFSVWTWFLRLTGGIIDEAAAAVGMTD